MSIAVTLALCLAPGPLASRQSDDTALVRLELRVTAVAGGAAYVDRGADDGLEAGDRVRFFPSGAPVEEGEVRSLASRSARVELRPGPSAVRVDTRGEVDLPAARLEPGPAADAAPAPLPERSAWSRPPETWDTDMPLLAGVQRREPGTSSEVSGRTWLRGFATSADANGRRRYDSVRAGFDLTLSDAFVQGGRLELDMELSRRTTDVDVPSGVGADETTSRLRIERAAYRFGAGRARSKRGPAEWSAGRFLSRDFPEFGVIDGLEGVWRTGTGRVGVSAGLLPEPTDAMASSDDLGAAVYWALDAEDLRSSLAAGYQKTWHDRHPDRDLIVVKGHATPGARTRLQGTAWVDLYTGGDARGEGGELTQAHLRASRQLGSASGVELFGSRLAYPELERLEFAPVSADELRDDHTESLGVGAWSEVSRGLRVGARLERWRDEDAEGGSAELSLTLRDLLWSRGELSLTGFGSEQEFSDVVGLRVSASRSLRRGQVRLDLRLAEHDLRANGPHGMLSQGHLRASWDLALGADLDLGLYVEGDTGDELDARTLGFHLTRRF